ncbi:MAG: YhfC family glutamic-type intramembrane protease [Candidatus Altiarchaeia archaeon]
MDSIVLLTFLFVSFVEIVFPLALGYFLIKKYKLSWKVCALGVLFFILVQLIHTPLVLVMQQPMTDYVGRFFPDHTMAVAAYAIILGLLAGLFEELGRFIVYGRFFIRNRIDLSVRNGVLFGAGWGGVESMIIGLLILLASFSYMYAAPLTDEQVRELNVSMNGTLTSEKAAEIDREITDLMALTPWDILPGMAERIFAVTLHITWSVMVLSAVVEKRNVFLVLAVLWHSATDALAVFIGQIYGVMAAEGVLFVFALAGFLYLRGQWSGANAKPSL